MREDLLESSATLGLFSIRLTGGKGHPLLSVLWQGKTIWTTCQEASFICASEVDLQVKESRGFFKLKETVLRTWQHCELKGLVSNDDSIVLKGTLSDNRDCLSWTIIFTLVHESQLAFDFRTEGEKTPNCVVFNWQMETNEKVFGLGTQFTHFDLSGKKVPILSQEPGIGRGVQPLTWFMETFFGAGGTTVNSNAPSSHFVTSHLKSLALENKQYSEFNFENPGYMSLKVYAPQVKGRFFFGETPATLIEAATRFTGRMPVLPRWLQRGAVIGMQGGRTLVEQRLERLKTHRAALAAVWLQD